MRWCRLYTETTSDPKLRRIAHTANATMAATLAVWTSMLCHAASNEGEAWGTLAGWDDLDCAINLGIDRAIVFAIRHEMEGRTLDGFRIIAWQKRQYVSDNGAVRMRKWREKKAQETQAPSEPVTSRSRHGDATVTAKKRREETYIVEDKSSTHPKPRKRGSGADADFDIFWSLYPRKVGKGAAERVWQRAVAEAGGSDEIVFALRQQLDGRHSTVAPKSGPEFIPHASTYLNQKRWLDGAQQEQHA